MISTQWIELPLAVVGVITLIIVVCAGVDALADR
jgi:hypothetical protein